MSLQTSRLDRLLSKSLSIPKSDIRLLVAAGQVKVSGEVCYDVARVVNVFTRVSVNGEWIQRNTPRYIMLNKPAGYVCATKDDKHPTVMDLVKDPVCPDLHIAGRLDLNSTGLVLLTNDSTWSERLTFPGKKVSKVYLVEVANPIEAEYQQAFGEGMYFSYEGITTKPVTLEVLGERTALVTLTEGRYHQIKRMFGRFRNPVIGLHRQSVGAVSLDHSLQAGDYRDLSNAEVLAAVEQRLDN